MRQTHGDGSRSGWAVPLTVLIIGMFLAVLGTSIINVAIPAIQKDLGAGADEARWVSTAYLLTLGVVVPLSSWLSDRLGQTRLYLSCLVGFTLASALCGMAWDLTSLIAFRVLQAIPGGVIPVITMTMLYQLVPPAKIGTAMGMYGLGVILAPATGPAVGGYLVEYTSWHLIFFVMVPVGALATVTALLIFPRKPPTTWPRFDLLGFLTIAYGLVALMLGADRGPDWGWTSYPVLILFVSSALSLALFVVVELEVDQPLVDVRVFTNFQYNNSLLLISVNSLGLFALLYYVPQFLQVNQGLQAMDAGLLLMPSALAMALMAPVAGRLYDRFGSRWPAVVGLGIAAWGSLLLAGITPDVPQSQLIIWTTIRNIGVGLSMMPTMTAGIAALRPRQLSTGSSMNNVVLRVSSSLGIAVVGGLVTAQHAQLMNDRSVLVDTGHSMVGAAVEKGRAGLGMLYQGLNQYVATTTYANAFYLVAIVTCVGIVLALFTPSGRPVRAGAGPAKPSADPAPASGATREGAAEQPAAGTRPRERASVSGESGT